MKQSRLLSVLSLALVLMISFSSCNKVKDADLKAAIEQQITSNPDLAGITVDVQKGIATLSGAVKDDATIAVVTAMAKGIKGIKEVASKLTVTPPQPVVNPDSALEAALKDAIKDNAKVVASVKDGIVTLTGEIKKADLPKLMQKISALKPTKIDSKLTVK